MAKNTFTYIEDNGGGLHLFVMKNGKVVDGITNLEYAPAGEWNDVKNRLMKDAVGAIRTWDGHMKDHDIDPKALYDEFVASKYGYKIVADNDGIYPDSMGCAAKIYFGVENE